MAQVERAQDSGDELLHEVRDGVAYVTFNRPQARNALTFAMYDRLAAICEAVNADRGIRGMLVTGAGGKAFAAGTDITQFRAFETREDALGYEARIDRVLVALERCRVPTVAVIAGACTGGGAAIAACCDLRIASPDSRFGFPVARTLGNCLSMSNYGRLAALIGPARVKEMILTARLLGADEARDAGFLTEVVAAEALAARGEDLVRTAAANAPLTIEVTKEALRRLQPRLAPGEGDDLLLTCYMSNDFREGMEAFLAKRPPNWTGT